MLVLLPFLVEPQYWGSFVIGAVCPFGRCDAMHKEGKQAGSLSLYSVKLNGDNTLILYKDFTELHSIRA